jgi:NADH:ubiquinone oxidoreductase subunit E
MTSGELMRAHPDAVHSAIDGHPPGRASSAVLRLLSLAQAAYGSLTEPAIREVAALTGLEPTRVRGLAGFYSLFYDAPRGVYVIHFCNDLPCALRGAEGLLRSLCDKLGLHPGETSPDGLFTLQTTTCLAACDRAPVMQVNLEYFHDLTEGRLDEIVADLRALVTDSVGRPPLGVGLPSALRGDGPDG